MNDTIINYGTIVKGDMYGGHIVSSKGNALDIYNITVASNIVNDGICKGLASRISWLFGYSIQSGRIMNRRCSLD